MQKEKLFANGKKIIFVLGCTALLFDVIILINHAVSGKAYITIQKPSAGRYALAGVVTAPLRFEQAENAAYVPFALTLQPAESAHIQFSLFKGSLQSNMKYQYQFDKSVVRVENDASGAYVYAVDKGQTMLSAIINGDIKPICLITVNYGEK